MYKVQVWDIGKWGMYHLIVQKLTYQTWAHCHQKEGGDLNRKHLTKNNAYDHKFIKMKIHWMKHN